ncbi:MAG TPA: CBS domain-containing protein, partial [Nitrospirales bacterium]|nr:CBS domain-containing protein [Nitrospirales bacterium]
NQILELLHPVYYVPETMKVSLLLKEMQRRRVHMAIVVNEHGSLEGLVTLEDLIEEIVGEIHDEYDDSEEQAIEQLQDGTLIIDAACTADDLRTEYGLPVQESPEYETLGGFMLDRLQSMARGGDVIRHDGYKFTVVDMDERRIKKVKVERETSDQEPVVPQDAA